MDPDPRPRRLPDHPGGTRFDGRDGGPRRRALRRLDPARRPQLPDLGAAHAAAIPAVAGPRSSSRRPRPTRRWACSTPAKAQAIAAAAREVADGRHDEQFPIDVYQTGSGTSTNTNMNEVVAHLASARLGAAGPSQRRRQPLPELERRHPDGAPALGRRGDRGGADPGADRAAVGPGGQGRRVLGRRQDRADPPPGRDADPARPGVRGLRGPGRGGDPARAGGARRAADGAPRRNRGRDRDQRPPGVRGASLPAALGAHRAVGPRGAEPLPRPGDARCRDRRPWRAAVDRARPVEGRLRRPADGHGPARRPRASSRCPRRSPGRRSCRAR